MRHSRQAQSGTYSNMFVRGHKYGPGWGPILSAVARLGFILRFLVPGDLLEFLALFKSLGPVPGAVVPPHHLVWLFLGHLIKWPPCVARWAAVLAAERPADPAGIVQAFTPIVQWANGHGWPVMFQRLDAGPAHGRPAGLADAGVLPCAFFARVPV